jgi:hypothetical protein
MPNIKTMQKGKKESGAERRRSAKEQKQMPISPSCPQP